MQASVPSSAARPNASSALADMGLIDEYEFLVQPVLAGHGPTLLAGLRERIELEQVDAHGGGLGGRGDDARDEAAGGAPVDPAALAWWEIFGNWKWAVICRMQAERHKAGKRLDVELATIGRRVAELARAFGMTVTAYDPFVKPDVMAKHGVRPAAAQPMR